MATPTPPGSATSTQPAGLASQPPPPLSSNPRSRKRMKISVACEPCRGRKVRCDGGRPLCGPCSDRGRNNQPLCIYKSNRPQDTIDPHTTSLIDRIQVLERVVARTSEQISSEPGRYQQHQDTATPSSEPSHAKPCSPPSNQQKDSCSETERVSTPHHPLPIDVPRISDNGWPKDAPIDSLHSENQASPVNAMGATSYVDSRGVSPSNEFYGSSSAAHFMYQAKEAMPRPNLADNSLKSPASNRTEHFSPRSSSCDQAGLQGKLSLPTRDLADMLLDKYWTKAHSLYPFIHKPSFMTAYANIWLPSKESQRCSRVQDLGLGTPGISDSRSHVFHCALNAIFALGCQLAGTEISIEDRETLSQTFFLRSKALLHVDILDHGSIAIVQTLLIVAQYLQSTSFPSRCWTALGLACRIGQGLGLHVEDCRKQTEPHDSEIRRRVWYGCVILDVVASMTLGRPMMTPYQRTIPIPSPSDIDDILSHDGEQFSLISFYIETISLYLILGKILTNVYKPWLGRGNTDPTESITPQHKDLEVIMALDEEMASFEDGITSWLHWERGVAIRDSLPTREQMILQRQTNVLHARFLHVRILLHRPIFLRYCRELVLENSSSTAHESHSQRSWNFRSKINMQSSGACIRAAIDLVRLIDDATRTGCDGAWWYTTFYLCTAAMVLILAQSCITMHQDLDAEEAYRAWLLCCDVLRLLVRKGHPAENTLNGLCNMYRRLVPVPNQIQLPTSRQSTEIEINGRGKDGREEGDDAPYQHNASLGASSYQEQYQTSFEGRTVDASMPASVNPLMDFMTHDVDLMTFGLVDEHWWQ